MDYLPLDMYKLVPCCFHLVQYITCSLGGGLDAKRPATGGVIRHGGDTGSSPVPSAMSADGADMYYGGDNANK